MEAQQNLFTELVEPIVQEEATLEERFAAFHRANPQVLEAFIRLARKARDHGVKRYGINALAEVLRWETRIETRGSGWKINNSFRPFYARLAMVAAPDLDGFFETRAGRHHHDD